MKLINFLYKYKLVINILYFGRKIFVNNI